MKILNSSEIITRLQWGIGKHCITCYVIVSSEFSMAKYVKIQLNLEATMSFSTKLFWIVLVVLIVLVAECFHSAVDVFAMGDDMRSNACRTWHTFSTQKDVDTRQEIDGVPCGTSDKQQSTDNDTNTSVVTSTNVTTITQDTPVSNDTPVVNNESDDSQDNGNHYGNDKPDNNNRDVKNPHNGENTKEEHHDH